MDDWATSLKGADDASDDGALLRGTTGFTRLWWEHTAVDDVWFVLAELEEIMELSWELALPKGALVGDADACAPKPGVVKPEFVNLYWEMLVDCAAIETKAKRQAEQEMAEFWEEKVDMIIAEGKAWVSLAARDFQRHKYWSFSLKYGY